MFAYQMLMNIEVKATPGRGLPQLKKNMWRGLPQLNDYMVGTPTSFYENEAGTPAN